MAKQLEKIPQPPVHLFGLTGNLQDVDGSSTSRSWIELAALYGPIFRVDLGRDLVVVSNQELVDEVCGDDRFEKFIIGNLNELRPFIGDGLFTSKPPEEPAWGIAHRLLMPVFGPLAIRKMFPQMMDIASQLILKWDRSGPDEEFDISDQFTRMTFDTIGLCAFNHRFNSFYSPNVHPFATQMSEVLVEADKRGSRSKLETRLRFRSQEKFDQNVKKMHELCDGIIAERKLHPAPEVHDLLNVMLQGRDPETGEGLSDENIRYQMGTFLVAGHDTTSGLLSFLFYELLKNPEKLHAAQRQVDEVMGDNALHLKHIPRLDYIDACLKESLRMHPPVPQNSRHAKEDTLLGGRFAVSKNTQLILNIRTLQRDPKIWSPDPDVFRPERMLNGGFESIPPNSWKPFGTSMRACIGRAFAWQEAMMVTALILQRFQLEMANPSYELTLKSTLTIKPANFGIKARRRPGKSADVGLHGGESSRSKQPSHLNPEEGREPKLPKVTVLYGSNSGTCQTFAEELRTTGLDFGADVQVNTLDSGTEHIPTDHPVIVITSSYEGQPPNNGKKFITWLEANASNTSIFKGIEYAVFGVGNSDWAGTYHRIPKFVNDLMGRMGAKPLCPIGLADVKVDIVGPWEIWSTMLWKTLREKNGSIGHIGTSALEVSIERSDTPGTLEGKGMTSGVVRANEELAGTACGPAKKHMAVELPEGMTYVTGDYLVVLPMNPSELVHRVLKRFGISEDDQVKFSGTRKSYLPTKTAQSAFDLLTTRIELSTPITQNQIAILVTATSNEREKSELSRLNEDTDYHTEILTKRTSVLDLLEDFPSCELPFASYIDMLQPLKPRQYSISSSPLASVNNPRNSEHATIATITYDVHDAPAYSGHGRRFQGIASSYLASRTVGAIIHCLVRSTNINFRLPADPETPIIMIAAGTGLAPMRGFLQERAAMHEAGGQKLGPTVLYFGCRDYEKDYIYRNELEKWERDGIVQLRTVFSKRPPPQLSTEEQAGSMIQRHVPDRIWAERDHLSTLFRDGAKILLCGSAAKLGKSTGATMERIYREAHSCSEQEAHEWLQGQKENRYVSDVFE